MPQVLSSQTTQNTDLCSVLWTSERVRDIRKEQELSSQTRPGFFHIHHMQPAKNSETGKSLLHLQSPTASHKHSFPWRSICTDCLPPVQSCRENGQGFADEERTLLSRCSKPEHMHPYFGVVKTVIITELAPVLQDISGKYNPIFVLHRRQHKDSSLQISVKLSWLLKSNLEH